MTRPSIEIHAFDAQVPATRGCAHACAFCSTRYVHGLGFRTRPVDHVITDIERAGNRLIAFLDDNLAADEAFAKELFTAMIPHGKKFFMQSHVLLAENEELLSLAAKAGCLGVFVGVESVSAAALSEANKGFNKVERLKDNIARFHDRGILVDGGIIFGYPFLVHFASGPRPVSEILSPVTRKETHRPFPWAYF